MRAQTARIGLADEADKLFEGSGLDADSPSSFRFLSRPASSASRRAASRRRRSHLNMLLPLPHTLSTVSRCGGAQTARLAQPNVADTGARKDGGVD